MKEDEYYRIIEHIDTKFKKLNDEITELKRMIIMQNNHDFCSDGGDHEYPNAWFATVPPHCRKCGKQGKMYQMSTISTSGIEIKIPDGKTSDAAGYNFDQFGGNLMYNQLSLDFDNTNPIIDFDNSKPKIDFDSSKPFTLTKVN